MVQVPFKGGGRGIVGLLSGQVQLYFATISDRTASREIG